VRFRNVVTGAVTSWQKFLIATRGLPQINPRTSVKRVNHRTPTSEPPTKEAP
jgi:hypothetical protein